MCMQCMAGASLAVGGAAGTRAWLATRTWITPVRLKRATVALIASAVLASSALPGGAANTGVERRPASPAAALPQP